MAIPSTQLAGPERSYWPRNDVRHSSLDTATFVLSHASNAASHDAAPHAVPRDATIPPARPLDSSPPERPEPAPTITTSATVAKPRMTTAEELRIRTIEDELLMKLVMEFKPFAKKRSKDKPLVWQQIVDAYNGSLNRMESVRGPLHFATSAQSRLGNLARILVDDTRAYLKYISPALRDLVIEFNIQNGPHTDTARKVINLAKQQPVGSMGAGEPTSTSVVSESTPFLTPGQAETSQASPSSVGSQRTDSETIISQQSEGGAVKSASTCMTPAVAPLLTTGDNAEVVSSATESHITDSAKVSSRQCDSSSTTAGDLDQDARSTQPCITETDHGGNRLVPSTGGKASMTSEVALRVALELQPFRVGLGSRRGLWDAVAVEVNKRLGGQILKNGNSVQSHIRRVLSVARVHLESCSATVRELAQQYVKAVATFTPNGGTPVQTTPQTTKSGDVPASSRQHPAVPTADEMADDSAATITDEEATNDELEIIDLVSGEEDHADSTKAPQLSRRDKNLNDVTSSESAMPTIHRGAPVLETTAAVDTNAASYGSPWIGNRRLIVHD